MQSYANFCWFSLQFTGDWYPVARLRNTGVLDSARLRIHVQDDHTYTGLLAGSRLEFSVVCSMKIISQ